MRTQYAGTPTGTGPALPQYLSDAEARQQDEAAYERALYPAPSAAERTLEVLTDDPDECFIAAEIGEYDGEREALGLLLSVLADHKENKTGREADILRRCDQLIDLVFKNRGDDYWRGVDRRKAI
ncbi:hypothetical protein FVQ98_10455 [Ottowia sp. GY511]|uniref:Uncharacterized protein n=1 Tax=Ottowia flava TaxID=2675430 RepID=A0ABW4KPN4_9BURK|nr:hypothetical protein [Ottowia sp. GY511]TXK27734.1 hypothetical protein FVQ98_10455 [Ottowia sp. GY511]